MAIDNKNQKPIGSFYNNHGRWAWLVRLPGDNKRRTISLVPPGQKMALKHRPDNEPDAWRIAWQILRDRTSDAGDRLTISAMAGQYLQDQKPRLSASQFGCIENALRWIVSDYGKQPADSIGIDEMRAVRDAMKAHYVRETANKYIRVIQRCYNWAKDEGFVDAHTAALVNGFGLIQPGTKCGGKYKNIKPVDIKDVQATLPSLTPTVRDMVIVQFVCDMRPGEACCLRMCDIDTSENELWIYEPPNHKNSFRGKIRLIAIFPEAREIIERRAKSRNADDYIFTVEESEKERLAAAHAARKTPLSCGNKPGTNKKGTRKYLQCFDSNAYAKHITRTIKQLNKHRKIDGLPPINSWTPNQLRHAKATENRAKHGKEIAAMLLGHAVNSGATDIYTRQAIKDEFREKAKAELREIAKKISQDKPG